MNPAPSSPTAVRSATGGSLYFFAVPAHHLTAEGEAIETDELLEPELPFVYDAIDKALAGAEFRSMRARDKVRALLSPDSQERRHGSPGEGYGPSAVFATSPGDLPALLRMADQMELLADAEPGERALVWRCDNCQTRYAVPVALVRRVTIRCERCAASVELAPERSAGEESLLEPSRIAVNQVRKKLAEFFRDAMARGWPVLVAQRKTF